MDFIISYYLHNKLKKEKPDKKTKELINIEENKPLIKSCECCGQNIYFCQCINNKYKSNFNPEKDIY